MAFLKFQALINMFYYVLINCAGLLSFVQPISYFNATKLAEETDSITNCPKKLLINGL